MAAAVLPCIAPGLNKQRPLVELVITQPKAGVQQVS
jgi:hypothetical protein